MVLTGILKFLVVSQVEKANAHYHAKFHQNQSIGCRIIVFNGFQNGSQSPSLIFKICIFEQLLRTEGLMCIIVQNFVKIGQTAFEISQFFDFSR